VLVTGAAGFLGEVLCGLLREHGHDVRPLFRDSVDLRDGNAVRAWCAGVTSGARPGDDIDAVAHLAGQTKARESLVDPAASWAANVGGTANLVSELGRNGLVPAVVYASTTAVYGNSHTGALTEDLPLDPGSPYAASKATAEEVLRQQTASGRCGATVLRCANIAGGWKHVSDPDRTRIVNNALAVAAEEKPHVDINGDGSAVRDFIHVWDVAQAFRMALETTAAGRFRVFNVGTGQGASMTEVIDAARAVTGDPIPVEHKPAVEEPQRLVADASRIRAELGWKPERSDIATIVRDAWAARRAR
jgi:UDP-glucose 4-epimerase